MLVRGDRGRGSGEAKGQGAALRGCLGSAGSGIYMAGGREGEFGHPGGLRRGGGGASRRWAAKLGVTSDRPADFGREYHAMLALRSEGSQ